MAICVKCQAQPKVNIAIIEHQGKFQSNSENFNRIRKISIERENGTLHKIAKCVLVPRNIYLHQETASPTKASQLQEDPQKIDDPNIIAGDLVERGFGAQ